jgi:hypothetical protein
LSQRESHNGESNKSLSLPPSFWRSLCRIQGQASSLPSRGWSGLCSPTIEHSKKGKSSWLSERAMTIKKWQSLPQAL